MKKYFVYFKDFHLDVVAENIFIEDNGTISFIIKRKVICQCREWLFWKILDELDRV